GRTERLTDIENPALVVAVPVGPGVPAPSPLQVSPTALGLTRLLPPEGFVAQQITPAPVLAAAAGQFVVGGGDMGSAVPEAEALPTTLAGRGGGTVLPMQRTSEDSLGVA